MQKINIEDISEFSADKSTRKGIIKAGVLDTGLLLYAPRQSTPDHKHSDIDEVFYVVSGAGIITANDEPVSVQEKDIVFSPHGERHSFLNNTSSDWTVLQIKISLQEGK